MKKAIKVCHITSVHIPFDTRIFYKQCSSLRDAGYDVHLVAKKDSNEIRDGITIHAVPPVAGKIKRMLLSSWRVYRKALAVNAEVYHFHDPELMPFGILLKLHGKKVICDVHEDYPDDIMFKEYIPSIFRKPISLLVGIMERIYAPFYDAVVVVTPKIFERFSRFKKETFMICNFPVLDELLSGEKKLWSERKRAVCYVGNLTVDRAIREMVKAAGIVKKSKGIDFIIGGAFSSKALEDEINAMPEFDYVDYRGFMNRREVAGVLSEVTGCVVFPHPNSNHKFAYTNKLFEYMSAGLPVIASDFPLWRSIVDSAECGILVEPKNVQALADAIIRVVENSDDAERMGKNGRKAIEEKYNWETEKVKLLGLYSRLIEKN